jgi:hypothetical protein
MAHGAQLVTNATPQAYQISRATTSSAQMSEMRALTMMVREAPALGT